MIDRLHCGKIASIFTVPDEPSLKPPRPCREAISLERPRIRGAENVFFVTIGRLEWFGRRSLRLITDYFNLGQ